MKPLDSRLEATIAVLQRMQRSAVERLGQEVLRTHAAGGTIFICGNGGSATTAAHFAQDLGKSTLHGTMDADRLRVLSLAENLSGLTAWANDHGYESVFEQPLRALGRPGDLLVALSGSGNSPNVLRAVEYANQTGIGTFALVGFDGGTLKHLARDCVHVEIDDMEIAENAHLVIAHLVVGYVRDQKRSSETLGQPRESLLECAK
jgi:D-sedoheptulose 7-phosphate isomerase